MENAIAFCDILDIPFEIEPPREKYYNRWDDDCLGAKLTVFSGIQMPIKAVRETVPSLHDRD